MRIRDNLPERCHLDNLQDFIPQVSFAGRSRLSQTRPQGKMHVHNNTLEILYVVSGQVTYRITDTDHLVKGGEIFLTFPDEIHCTSYHPHMHFYWFGLDINSPDRKFLGLADPEAKALRAALQQIKMRHFKGSPVAKECIGRFIDAALSDTPYRKLIAQSAVIELLTYLIDAEKQQQQIELCSPVYKALKIMEKEIEESISLQKIADSIHVSLSHFHKIFRQEMGISPYDYILHRKIERAKKLLIDPVIPITEIAFRLGFPSSQHFATLFKKITAQTPSAFRKECQSAQIS